MRHRLIFFCLCFFCSLIVYGQNISITGNVKDKNGDPLIGVTVQVKGTTSGTVTDFDGNYVLMIFQKIRFGVFVHWNGNSGDRSERPIFYQCCFER